MEKPLSAAAVVSGAPRAQTGFLASLLLAGVRHCHCHCHLPAGMRRQQGELEPGWRVLGGQQGAVARLLSLLGRRFGLSPPGCSSRPAQPGHRRVPALAPSLGCRPCCSLGLCFHLLAAQRFWGLNLLDGTLAALPALTGAPGPAQAAARCEWVAVGAVGSGGGRGFRWSSKQLKISHGFAVVQVIFCSFLQGLGISGVLEELV